MVWTEAASGSEVLTGGGTEDELFADTIGGDYILYFDLNSMAAADRIILRVYVKPTTGDTERLLYGPSDGCVYTDAQESPMKVSVPVSVAASGSVRATLAQTNGTNRTIPWWLLLQS